MVNETQESVDEQVDGEQESRINISQEEIEKLKNRNVAVLTVMMPPGLRDKVHDAAEAQDKSDATFVRELIANALGFELVTTGGRTKTSTLSDAERAERNKAKAKERRDTVNELMKRLKAGEISL